MTSAAAAARSRFAVTVTTVLASLVVVLAFRVAHADGATRAWSSYLAPAGVCAAADDAAAPAAAQARAIACLLNWARSKDGRGPLTSRPALRRAAALKGERVASCVQLSHTPCGTSVTAAVQAAGYRYSSFGENLFAGSWGAVSARDVLRAWLQSPPHRSNLLHPGFRDIGVAPARAPGLLGNGDAVVWTVAFASPRR